MSVNDTGDNMNDGVGDAATTGEARAPIDGARRATWRERRQKPHRPVVRLAIWMSSGMLALGILAGVIVATLGDRTVTAPDWVTERVQNALNAGIAPARITLSEIEVTFRRGAAPSVAAVGASFYDAEGRYLAFVPRARAALDRAAMLSGRLSPQSLLISGLRMRLTRDADGRFAVSMGERPGVDSIGGSPAEIIDQLNRLFETRGLEALDLVDARDVTISIADEMSGKRWEVTEGRLAVERAEDAAELRVTLASGGFGGQPARVSLSVVAASADHSAQVGASIRNVSATDIGALGPSLSWLRPLEAPVSGSMRLEIGSEGQLAAVHGALDIGGGQARIPGTDQAVGVTKARAYFDYDPARLRLQFTELALQTSALDLSAEGQMFVRADAPQGPELVTQLQFSQIAVRGPEGALVRPAVFEHGGTDFRLRFDPFRLEVGQFSLAMGDTRIVASGRSAVGEDGLSAGADLSINRIAARDFLALWPPSVIPKTREWVEASVDAGVLSDMHASFRTRPDGPPVAAAGWRFRDATLRYIPKQPPITGLTGYAMIVDDRFTAVAETGQVTPAQGGPVDIAGTVFVVPDVVPIPATGEITLHARGPITAQLSILDTEPFGFLTKAGQPVDLATGSARADGRISVLLVDNVTDEDIAYDVEAELVGVGSDTLIPGYALRADRLRVSANREEGLRISGAATLNGVPIEGEWILPLEPSEPAASRLTGAVEVSQRTSDLLALGLPPQTLRGVGIGRVEVDFPVGDAPRLRFFSDMNRIAVEVPELGYSKPSNRTGEVEIMATLASPPTVESVRLDLPGLSAEGGITVTEAGALGRAAFRRVRVGSWFDGPVDLIGHGKNRPMDIKVRGGRFDLRTTTASANGGRGGEAGRMEVALDSFVVSDGMRLTNVEGSFDLAKGLRGPFSGRVNAGTRVSGDVKPSRYGTAVTLTGTNAGRVLVDAGFISQAQEGDLTLTLTPRATEGFYDGALEIKNIWIGSVPALAELVSAVSVVGLLEQLSGKGIFFGTVSARFVLGPENVLVTASRAEGASLGLTMDGTYGRADGAVDMQGVVTPVYLINGLGQIVSRRGEGLIGISYKMKGTFEDPKVRVNPLSLLTPGFLREIFRKPLPKPGDEATEPAAGETN